MKLRVAALVLAQLVGCTHREPPIPVLGRDASQGSAAPVAPSAATAATVALAEPPASSHAPDAGAAPPPSASGSSSPPAAPTAFPEPVVTNRDGLRGLLAALKDVDRIELVRWDPPAKPEPLSADDKLHLLQLMRGGALTNTRTVAHPPWPAAFVFFTRSHGTYAAILVGASTLRLDTGRASGRFEGAAARWNTSPPPEMALDDDDRWLWSYLESRLGETREQEYLMQKAPYPIAPPRRP